MDWVQFSKKLFNLKMNKKITQIALIAYGSQAIELQHASEPVVISHNQAVEKKNSDALFRASSGYDISGDFQP